MASTATDSAQDCASHVKWPGEHAKGEKQPPQTHCFAQQTWVVPFATAMPSPHSPRTPGGSSVLNESQQMLAGSRDEWYMRSLLGSQVEARHETAPMYGFGPSQRAVHNIMYSGPGSDKGRPARLSPGPIYLPDANGVGRGPKFSFGTGPAAGACAGSASKWSASQPGPGEYELAASVGMQASSLARSAPSYGWGSAVRNTGGARTVRGETAAAYELRASVGPQALSNKHNAPTFKYGTSQRFGTDRGELRRQAAAPGPGSYSMPVAVAERVRRRGPAGRAPV